MNSIWSHSRILLCNKCEMETRSLICDSMVLGDWNIVDKSSEICFWIYIHLWIPFCWIILAKNQLLAIFLKLFEGKFRCSKKRYACSPIDCITGCSNRIPITEFALFVFILFYCTAIVMVSTISMQYLLFEHKLQNKMWANKQENKQTNKLLWKRAHNSSYN